ncbi:hypothetical protein [Arthrobacter sp. AZCC_0090]|uniref:hypothetical protein n=1 Tax=Arthrobacter sp. AZCC_0090 TaxID=2735881 RepID=UPI00161AE7A3|nr:hypothetical protein [Arthrobacter sp. AZCC_0090]MBB6402807.1 hypothetical protein [Arthrobacter sp. AZCC_0090]
MWTAPRDALEGTPGLLLLTVTSYEVPPSGAAVTVLAPNGPHGSAAIAAPVLM